MLTVSHNRQVQKRSTELQKAFRWKDRDHNFHYPKDMATRHLFFTLRMIWNHSVPDQLKILPYTEYHFSPFYTVEYMTEAVRHLATELATRKDLTPYYIKCLQKIQGCINIHNETQLLTTGEENHGE